VADHKDLKPQNIRITKKNIPKIIDFGTMKNINNNLSIEGNEKISGSLAYMAPEIMLKKEKATKKSDIYSLGCILYEIINKKNYLELCEIDDIPINKMIFHNGELNNENIVSISHSINNDNVIYNIIALATTFSPKNRISNIEEIIQLLDRKYLKCDHDRFFYLSKISISMENITKIKKSYFIIYSDSMFLIIGFFVMFYFNNFILYILGIMLLMFGITITLYRFNELLQLYKSNYDNKGIIKFFFLGKSKKAMLLLGNLLIIIFLLSDFIFFLGIFVIISTLFLKKDSSEKFEIKKSLLKKMVKKIATITKNYMQNLYKYYSK